MSNLTKKALAEALKERLKSNTLDSIRVKDIAADVGVNRQTFYYHFEDIYALVEWMFEEEANAILGGKMNHPDITELIGLVARQIEEEKTILKNIYVSVNRQLLDDYLRKWVRPIVAYSVRDIASGREVLEEDMEFITDAYVMVIMGLAFEFIETDTTLDYSNRIDKWKIFMDGDILDTIKRFERSK